MKNKEITARMEKKRGVVTGQTVMKVLVEEG